MYKKLMVVLLLLVLVFTAVPASAANYHNYDIQKIQMLQNPVIYKSTINVSSDGGIFDVGFATVKFPKSFIDPDQLPITLNVEISAINGVAGIEFSPDIPNFNKEVIIRINNYDGLLYDKTKGKNVWVHIKSQVLKVNHFSRYAFS
jgi:hypothetical protein